MSDSEYGPEFMRLLFTTITGSTKSIEISYDGVEEFLSHGYFFDGSSVSGYATVNASDLLLKPSLGKPIPDPIDSSVTMMLCGVHDTLGAPSKKSPRHVLEKVIQNAHELGLHMKVGAELEFFLLADVGDGIKTADNGGYCDTTPADGSLHLRRDIVRSLKRMGIPTVAHHHEVAQGQHEIVLRYGDARTIADSIILTRLAVAEIAHRYGSTATFMPKPFPGMNGSGLHLHQSLWDVEDKKNLFTSDDSEGLSEIGRHYVAGILEHARALSALVAPTINSYKRLTPGYEAPTRIAWGPRNRSTMIRIPTASQASSSTRIEYRCPDPLCNPYIALAGILSAGLDGIMKGLEPSEPTSKDLFEVQGGTETLPDSLPDALDELEKDKVLENALGRDLVDAIIKLRRQEWNEYIETTGNPGQTEITKWEIEKYLHVV
ncbi:MAG: type I glutamate--ammonia ligase [Candidatus Thorarchaeota archaeon]